MNCSLSIGSLKLPCTFEMRVCHPLDSMLRVTLFFKNSRILVDSFQLYSYRNGEAMLIIHCHLEKNKKDKIVTELKAMPDIFEFKTVNLQCYG